MLLLKCCTQYASKFGKLSSGHRTGKGQLSFQSQRKKRKESENEVSQSCPTLCDPRDCSLPGSYVHGIFQARILEWVAISKKGNAKECSSYCTIVLISHPSREGNCTLLQYSCLENPMDGRAWKAAIHGVAEGRTRLSDFTFIFHFHALEKEMATHSSVLAWRIPGMGKPGGLPSMGSHGVGHD